MIALLWILLLGGGWWLSNQWIEKRNLNSQPVHFLVDTGASQISIPVSVAERLNLRRGQPFPVTTANGEVTVYATRLDEVTIGPFSKQNVQAHINPGMKGEVALLGMSFLRHFDMIQRSGELTIQAP